MIQKQIKMLKQLKKQKKGILFPYVIRMLIAVICIGFLVILFLKWFFPPKTDLDKFEKKYEEISNLIQSLKEGESASYVMSRPAKLSKPMDVWELVYSDKVDNSECKENCLCICYDEKSNNDISDDYIQDTGVNMGDVHVCRTGICKNFNNIEKTQELISGINFETKDVLISKNNGLVKIEVVKA